MTETNDDRIYIRYLADAEVDDPRPDFLTIGSYPVADAYKILEEFAGSRGAVSAEAPGGALAVYSEDVPNSVYVAYPDEDVQIEVYDPDPDEALAIATSSRLRQIVP